MYIYVYIYQIDLRRKVCNERAECCKAALCRQLIKAVYGSNIFQRPPLPFLVSTDPLRFWRSSGCGTSLSTAGVALEAIQILGATDRKRLGPPIYIRVPSARAAHGTF